MSISARKAAMQKISKAKKTSSGTYFTPGKYQLVLDKVLMFENWEEKLYFVAEFAILASSSTGEKKRLPHESPGSETGPEYVPLKEGTRGSFVVCLSNSDAKGSQYSNVKNCLLALDEEEGDADLDNLLGQLFPEDKDESYQPLRGKRVNLTVHMKQKKTKKEEDFPIHTWEIVPQTAEELEAEAKKLTE